MARRKNKILKAPQILDDIAELIEQWSGTEHSEFVEELNGWRDQATKSLLKLSLQDNEGVALLLTELKQLADDIDAVLLTKAPKDMPDVERAQMMGYRDGLRWLSTFFENADVDLKQVQSDVDNQRETDANGV
jgi:hypothetical protein